jgi:hypothetical protein
VLPPSPDVSVLKPEAAYPFETAVLKRLHGVKFKKNIIFNRHCREKFRSENAAYFNIIIVRTCSYCHGLQVRKHIGAAEAVQPSFTATDTA